MKSTNLIAVSVAGAAAVLALAAGSKIATEPAAPAQDHAHNIVAALSAYHPAAHTGANVTCAQKRSAANCGGGPFAPAVTAPPAPTALPSNLTIGLPGNINTGPLSPSGDPDQRGRHRW